MSGWVLSNDRVQPHRLNCGQTVRFSSAFLLSIKKSAHGSIFNVSVVNQIFHRQVSCLVCVIFQTVWTDRRRRAFARATACSPQTMRSSWSCRPTGIWFFIAAKDWNLYGQATLMDPEEIQLWCKMMETSWYMHLGHARCSPPIPTEIPEADWSFKTTPIWLVHTIVDTSRARSRHTAEPRVSSVDRGPIALVGVPWPHMCWILRHLSWTFFNSAAPCGVIPSGASLHSISDLWLV